MRTIVWIVGEPGVGKTTLTRTFLDSLGPLYSEVQSPKWSLFGRLKPVVAAAGWWRGSNFDGSDTLAISQIKPAMTYWAEQLADLPLAILDGDKLSNSGAVAIAQAQGVRLVCFQVVGAPEAFARREARGTKQNESWVEGRRTKSENFVRSFPGERHFIPATDPPEKVQRLLQAVLL